MGKNYSSAYKRDISRRKALRKRRIAEEIYHDGKEYPYYNNLHAYDKGKIHCSCPMCSPKTRNKGSRRHRAGNYARHLNYKWSELKRQIAMDADLEEAIGFTGDGSKRKNDW